MNEEQKQNLAKRVKQLQNLTVIILLLMASVGVYQTLLNLSINVTWRNSQTLFSYNTATSFDDLAIDVAEYTPEEQTKFKSE